MPAPPPVVDSVPVSAGSVLAPTLQRAGWVALARVWSVIIGSYVGWFILDRFGMAMGLFGSLIGAAVAGYYANKWVKENLSV